MRFAFPRLSSPKSSEPVPAPWSSMTKAQRLAAAPARPVARRSSTDQYRAGVLHERARVQAVLKSEHYRGREASAADLLDSGLAADKIVAILAKTPKTNALPGIAWLKANTPPNPDLGAGREADLAAGGTSVWDRIRARSK
jgi:hypothetical protein